MPTFPIGQLVVVCPNRHVDAFGWLEGRVVEQSPIAVGVATDAGQSAWFNRDRLVAVDRPVLEALGQTSEHVRRLLLELVQHVRVMGRLDYRVGFSYLAEAIHTARALVHSDMVRSPSFEALSEVRAADAVVDAFRAFATAALAPFKPTTIPGQSSNVVDFARRTTTIH